MSEPGIRTVIEALQLAARLRDEVERLFKETTGYDFGYHYSREINAAEDAEREAGEKLDAYIDARVKRALEHPGELARLRADLARMKERG